MLRSVAKQRVSKHGAALVLRDASLRDAPQDEGGEGVIRGSFSIYRRQLFLIRNVSTRPLLSLLSILSPVSRIRLGMSMVVSGSVHSITSTSPAAILDS